MRPASIVGRSGRPRRKMEKPGVSLSQRLALWKRFIIHSSRITFSICPCNGSAIPCTLIHQAPAPEWLSTDYGPFTPPNLACTSPPSAPSISISPVRITACCRTRDPLHCLLHRPVQQQADCMTIPQIAVAWSVKALGRPHTNLLELLK